MKTDRKKTKRRKKKKNSNKIINKENILFYVFFALLLIVIFLGVLVIQASNKRKNTTGNIMISINEKHKFCELDLDLKELSKIDDYSLKLTNYNQKVINKDKYKYSLTILNDTGVEIYVWKDYKEKNLMVDQAATTIEGMTFGTSKKEFDIYHFSVIDKNKVKKDDKIHIEIYADKVV